MTHENRRADPKSRGIRFGMGTLLVAAWVGAGCPCGRTPVAGTLSVSFTSPTDTQTLKVTDDVDANTAGLQANIVVTATDSGGAQVTLAGATLQYALASSSSAATPGPAAQLNGATATFPAVSLPTGALVLTVNVTENGTNRTATQTIHVTVRPMVTAIAFQGDANHDNILNQAEQATGAPVAIVSTWALEDGQTVTVKDQNSATVYGTGTVASGTATVTLSALPVTGTTENVAFALVASIVSAGGEPNQIAAGTTADPKNAQAFVTLTVDRGAPALTLVSPTKSILLIADDGDKAMPDFQIVIVVQTDANATSVTFTPNAGSPVTVTPDATHKATYETTVTQAGPFLYSYVITASDSGGNVTTLTPAVLLWIGPTHAGFFQSVAISDLLETRNVSFVSPLFFVNPSNVNFFKTPRTAGFAADQGNTPNFAQENLFFNIAGGTGGTAHVVYNGADRATPIAVTGDQTIQFLGSNNNALLLPTATSGPIQIVVSYPDGSQAISSADAVVDTIPPAQTAAALTLKTTSPYSDRNPAVEVSWTASGQDGTSGGVPTGYDVRWSTNAVLIDLTGATNPTLNSDQVFFDSSRALQLDGGVLPSSVLQAEIPVPTIGTYYVQVRAVDQVGNYAPLLTVNCSTNAACIDHQLSMTTLSNPGSGGNFGFLLRSQGDLNGDGKDDLAIVSTGAGAQSLWVAYGSSGVPFANGSQSVTLPGVGNPAFDAMAIWDVSIGNTSRASTSSPPVQDLIAADPTWNTQQGRYLLFFGVTDGGTIGSNSYVEFRGTAKNSTVKDTNLNGSSRDQGYVKIIGDIGSPGGGPPDGISEIMFEANAEDGGYGNVYMFYGRSIASWQALQTAQDIPISPTFFIPTSSADRVFYGGYGTNAPDNSFGVKRGYALLGDITGDGIPDFTIPDSFSNRMLVFSGATVNGAAEHGILHGTDAIQNLTNLPASINWKGFGSDAFGGVNLIGGAANDLVVGNPNGGTVYLYADGSATGFQGSPQTITGPTRFGNVLAHSDIKGNGKQDLIIATNAFLANDGFYGAGWICYNTGTPGSEFDSKAQAFHSSVLTKDPNDPAPSNGLGISIATGDFNGDGKPDVAVSDWLAGSGAVGKVYVRY